MKLVDPEALLNELQERLSHARLLQHVAEADGSSEDIAEATGAVPAWREAGELVQDHLKAAPEVPAPLPVGPDMPMGVRILVWWRAKWHIASFHTDCPGCPGESCEYCYGASKDYWRDSNGELHEGMDENPPTSYLPLPAAPADVGA